jgi:hypothetical protein
MRTEVQTFGVNRFYAGVAFSTDSVPCAFVENRDLWNLKMPDLTSWQSKLGANPDPGPTND